MQNQLESRAYAGFFVRLVAYCIDLLIASIFAGFVKLPFTIVAGAGASILTKNMIFNYSFIDVLGYVGMVTYFVFLTYFGHATLGKKLFRLEVVAEDEWTFINILYRETVGRFLSSLLNIGYLAIFVQKEKQGFHDMLCDTHVVYRELYTRQDVREAQNKASEKAKNEVANHEAVNSEVESPEMEKPQLVDLQIASLEMESEQYDLPLGTQQDEVREMVEEEKVSKPEELLSSQTMTYHSTDE